MIFAASYSLNCDLLVISSNSSPPVHSLNRVKRPKVLSDEVISFVIFIKLIQSKNVGMILRDFKIESVQVFLIYQSRE